jgi:hypothetical protein
LHALQNIDPNIHISEFNTAKNVHFLDVTLTIEHNRIISSLYQKPSHLNVLLHFQSSHSPSLKQNIVLSHFIRIYKLSSNLEEAGYKMREFVYYMTRLRGLNNRIASQIWRRFLKWLESYLTSYSERSHYERPATLYVSNNVFVNPFRKAIQLFTSSLSIEDQLKVGPTCVRTLTDRNIGVQCFKS